MVGCEPGEEKRVMSKYRLLRLHGFDPLAAAFLAALSGMFQPRGIVRVLNIEFSENDHD